MICGVDYRILYINIVVKGVLNSLDAGTVQIGNWKPFNCDAITDNDDATVECILGELTSVITVRIQLFG